MASYKSVNKVMLGCVVAMAVLAFAGQAAAQDMTVAPVNCTSSEYLMDGTCTRCVSRDPSASLSKFRGNTCRNPTGRGDMCTPGMLYRVVIQAVSDELESSSCISSSPFAYMGQSNSIGGGNVEVNLLLPSKGYFTLKALTIPAYKIASISLAGIPAEMTTKTAVMAKGDQRLRVTFKDTTGYLQTMKGKTVMLTGVMQRAGDLLNLCFMAKLKVCAV